jgi:hypothetical protein
VKVGSLELSLPFTEGIPRAGPASERTSAMLSGLLSFSESTKTTMETLAGDSMTRDK